MPAADKTTRFHAWYRAYQPRIYRLCMGYTGGDVLGAQDLVQETFVKVWQHLDHFKGASQPGTWIYRIAVNTCLTHIRTQKRRPVQRLGETALQIPEPPPEHQEQLTMLYQCIARLPETDRLIISMVLEETPYEEIAAAWQMTENNLRVRIHRIKQKLTDFFNQYEKL